MVQGEVPECAYVIKSGVIKTYNLTGQGEEKPISFDVQGEVFPIGWVYSKIKWSQYYYEAFTDCEVYCIPRDKYIEYVKSDPEAMFGIIQGFIDFNLNYQMRINALEQSKAAAKVLNTIHFLCLQFGKELKEDMVSIQLPMTQQELANFMGLTRETTGIELKKLQRKGILSYKRQKYMVKTALLNDLLDEEYGQGIIR